VACKSANPDIGQGIVPSDHANLVAAHPSSLAILASAILTLAKGSDRVGVGLLPITAKQTNMNHLALLALPLLTLAIGGL